MPISPTQYNKTLAAKLAPTIDKIRGLSAKFGLRPYVVRLVRTRWTGEVRGDGVEEVIWTKDFVPTPKLDNNLGSIDMQLQNIGLDEQGSLRVSQISTSYTEQELLGKTVDNQSIPLNETFFWEVEFQRSDGTQPIKRRFYPDTLPTLDPGNCQWTINIKRAQGDR